MLHVGSYLIICVMGILTSALNWCHFLSSSDTQQPTSTKLHAAKLLLSRFDPTKQVFGTDEIMVEDIAEKEILDSLHGQASDEYEELSLFLDAHTAYEQALLSLAFTPRFATSSTMRTQQAKTAAYVLYVRKINSLLQTAVKATTKAEDLLQEVLSYPGGWLLDDSNDEIVHENTNESIALSAGRFVVDGTEQCRSQYVRAQKERQMLRQKCVSETIVMLHTILLKAASWAEDLLDKISISSDGVDGSHSESLRSDLRAIAKDWYSHALKLAHVVARDDICLLLRDDLRETFMTWMAEDAVKVLLFSHPQGDND